MTGAQRVSTQFLQTNGDKALLAGFKVILKIKGNQAAQKDFLNFFARTCVSAYESQSLSKTHLRVT